MHRSTQFWVTAPILALVLVTTSVGCSVRDTPQENSLTSTPRLEVGVHAGGQGIEKYERIIGNRIDHVLIFQPVKELDYSEVKTYLDQGYRVILNIEFIDSYPNLGDIAMGTYDDYMNEFADQIVKDGRQLWIRPLHEFNGNWYNWGVLHSENNTIDDFKRAWIHVVTLFRNVDAPVRFQLNYNRLNGKNDQTPFTDFYPGDDYVDMVVITSYNRAYTDEWHQYWHTFDDDFRPAYEQVIHMTNTTVGIAEMSSTSYHGDKPAWMRDACTSIVVNYTRVTQVTWFLTNKEMNDVLWDWDLNTPGERDAFKDCYHILKMRIE